MSIAGYSYLLDHIAKSALTTGRQLFHNIIDIPGASHRTFRLRYVISALLPGCLAELLEAAINL
jgi:hypothetical protein